MLSRSIVVRVVLQEIIVLERDVVWTSAVPDNGYEQVSSRGCKGLRLLLYIHVQLRKSLCIPGDEVLVWDVFQCSVIACSVCAK